jgi:hypothetical protein
MGNGTGKQLGEAATMAPIRLRSQRVHVMFPDAKRVLHLLRFATTRSAHASRSAR